MRAAKLLVVAALAGWFAPVERIPFRLVSIDPLPATDGVACAWPGGGLLESTVYAQSSESAGTLLDPTPLRTIQDTVATFSAVAVDPIRNEIVLQDENLFQIHVYDRTTATPADREISKPKRILEGPNTEIEFNCGLYIDPQNGDIY